MSSRSSRTCIDESVYIHMYHMYEHTVCTYIRMYVGIYENTTLQYIRMYGKVVDTYFCKQNVCTMSYVRTYTYMYVRMYVCMYV